MTPRKVYLREQNYETGGTNYVPRVLWAEFEGFGLISPVGYSSSLVAVSMNVIAEEKEARKGK